MFDEAELAEMNNDDQASIFNERQQHNEDEPLNIELQSPRKEEDPDMEVNETSIKQSVMTPERANLDLQDVERPQTAPVVGTEEQDFNPTAADVQQDMKMMKMIRKNLNQQVIANSRMSKQNDQLNA